MGRLREHFDEFGNPNGLAFDLGGGDEQRMRDEKILMYTPFPGEHGRHLIAAVSERNIAMDIVPAGSPLDEATLERYTQLWYVSGDRKTLTAHQVDLIADFVQRGNGLAIWADNEPYYADANLLAERLIGTSFSGYKQADEIMTPADTVMPGHFIEHQLTHGVNNLYEGVTICTIRPVEGLTILGQSHDGQLNIACFERGQERIVLDTGFTKLYDGYFLRAAGTARYLRNIAFWLARGSRGVEYRLLTPTRGKLASITAGQVSEEYRQTVTRPVALTYILSWEDKASLRLSIRDPRGQTVRDDTAEASPLRVTVPFAAPGEWTARVSVVCSGEPDVPYVLTVAVDQGRPQTAQQVPPPNVYQPIYLIVDSSRHMAGRTAAMMAGLHDLIAKLRQRTSPAVGVQMCLIAADATGRELVAPSDARLFTVEQLGAAGSCALGAALRHVVPQLSAASMNVKPLVVILLAGRPDDNWSGAADELHRLAVRGIVDVFVIGIAGYRDAQAMRQLATTAPLSLDTFSLDSVRELFGWVYQVADVSMTRLESGAKGASTPPLPVGLHAIT